MNTSNIIKAKEIAIRVHGDLVDKKDYPYMAHVFDVALRVAHLGESYEIVALLHDAIEDAKPEDFRKEITEVIETSFSKEIILAIKAMSKRQGEDYFEDYLPRLKANEIATQVKIADSSHNLSKAHLFDEITLQEKFRNKYIKVLNELGEDGKSCEIPLEYSEPEEKWILKNP
ncbi:GTP pyrophosphokinase [Gammaproteobacteria bacterium]|nr:GTP pyrophosphokinase [Gammaproteobacteria bacterium]